MSNQSIAPQDNEQEHKPFVNVEEAAQLLQCNPQTVRNLHSRGAFRGKRVGKRLMLDYQSILEWMRE